MDCLYLGEKVNRTEDGLGIHDCRIHKFCTKTGREPQVASCEHCKQKLTLDSPGLGKHYRDPLTVLDRHLNPTESIRHILAGGSAFLICGGPSAKNLPLERLKNRGLFSLAINNVAGWDRIRPQAFICSDPPSKFHDGIWKDPSMMKLIPIPKLKRKRGGLRRKVGPGQFEDLSVTTEDCPNMWGFGRRSWLLPDHTFFTDKDAAWGNMKAGVERTGEKKTACTMLLGIRLLYYLGARTIYLIGVDFGMMYGVGLQDNYSFGENRDENAVRSNNDQYLIAGDWLNRLEKGGIFQQFGLSIFNCNPHSNLRAFPFVQFDNAVDTALADFPSEPLDLEGWYVK